MALVQLTTCYSLAEALVIDSLLSAHGVRATLIGQEMARQRWDLTLALGGIPILISDADHETAESLIGSAVDGSAVTPWEAKAFWTNPLFNGAFALAVLVVLSGVWPVWTARSARWQSEAALADE
jgi:hypothetical protein